MTDWQFEGRSRGQPSGLRRSGHDVLPERPRRSVADTADLHQTRTSYLGPAWAIARHVGWAPHMWASRTMSSKSEDVATTKDVIFLISVFLQVSQTRTVSVSALNSM